MRKLVPLFLAVVCLLFLPSSFALEGVSREEVLEEASRLTGLSRDVLRLLYNEEPSLFVNLERVTFATRVLHLFAQAQDEELVAELLVRFIDDLRFVVLPDSMNTFLTAVKLYKASLEVIRDYVFIPKLDEDIYQSYRSVRLVDLRRGDESDESRSTAFEAATTRWLSKYYAVQDRMYHEMVKKKGYNESLVAGKLKQRLRAQIDQFWMNTLELRLQREIFAENEANVTAALWESLAPDVDRLQQEAKRYLVIPSPETQSVGLSAEEASFFSSFRKRLEGYLLGEMQKAFGDESFSVEIGEALKIGRDLYEVDWKIFQSSQDGDLVLISADSTRGTWEEFQEAIGYLEQKLSVLPESEMEILSRYQALLPRYLAKRAQEIEDWDRERGVQNACWFEILDGATPVASGRFQVHYRILCRLPDGRIHAPVEFAGELNRGEIEANIRTMLEYLHETEPFAPGEKKEAAASSPPPQREQEEPEHVLQEEPGFQENLDVVLAFRDFYPRYLQGLAQRETTRAREIFGYNDKMYWVEIVDNAREVAPGLFRVHYRNFVREGGVASCYNEYRQDLTVEGLARLLKNALEEMQE